MDYLNQPLATSINQNQNNTQPAAQPTQEGATAESTMNTASNYANSAYTSTANAFESARTSFNSTINDMSSKNLAESGNEFINSNTIVTKIVFLILVLIVFLILMNLGIFLIMYFMTPNKNPYLIKGMISGNQSKTILQDPKNSNAITLYRSNNRSDGIEFTWSTWLLRSNNEGIYTYSHIFNKGSSDYDTSGNGASGIANLGNAPGVYFYNSNEGNMRDYNNIKIIMDTVTSNTNGVVQEEVTVTNLPLGRWFHLAIRMENKIMDVYVNGTATKRVSFANVPFQNYRNVMVCQNGGFTGNMSDLRYFDSALSVFQIGNIVKKGPNTESANADENTKYNYLSSSWYTSY
jgi:hypothetical protein